MPIGHRAGSLSMRTRVSKLLVSPRCGRDFGRSVNPSPCFSRALRGLPDPAGGSRRRPGAATAARSPGSSGAGARRVWPSSPISTARPIRSLGHSPTCRRTTASSGRAIGASSSGRPFSRRARSRPGPSREPLEVLVPSPTIFFRSSSTSVTHGTSKTFAHVRGVTHLAHSSHVSSAPPERCETETRVGDLPAVLASVICPKGDDR